MQFTVAVDIIISPAQNIYLYQQTRKLKIVIFFNASFQVKINSC